MLVFMLASADLSIYDIEGLSHLGKRQGGAR